MYGDCSFWPEHNYFFFVIEISEYNYFYECRSYPVA